MKLTINYRVDLEKAAEPAHLDVQARFSSASALYRAGQSHRARTVCEEILRLQPRHVDSNNLLGVIAADEADLTRALELFDRAIAANSANADAFRNKASALRLLKHRDAALANYDRAIAIKDDFAEAYANRGSLLQELKRWDAALESYERAIAVKPDFAEVYFERGNVLQELGRWEAALASFSQGIVLRPHVAEAYASRGNVLTALRRWDAALRDYDRAVALKPALAEAHYDRGLLFKQQKLWSSSLASLDRAIAIKADLAEAYFARGDVRAAMKGFDAALCDHRRALEIKPDLAFAMGQYIHTRMHICDWEHMDVEVAEMTARLERGEAASSPLAVLGLSGSASLHRRTAEIWVREKCPPNSALPAIPKRKRHERIRVGYFSADFRSHPVSHLTAEIYELHDRSRFEIVAFAYGPESQDEMRQRLKRSFDRFIDVNEKSALEAAELARSMEIDIAVDLGGFTRDSRTEIFALRTAPLQISYIGYLGTLAAPYIDYLVADGAIVPPQLRGFYSEKLIYLPSYQANDSARRIADKAFGRQELGLPATGFVFCCFNASYKITPETFSCWMRLLGRVPGSVMFLLGGDPVTERNLRREAVQRGIEADRLVFGGPLAVPEYLARYRAADLFLDTLPYNAGTTASDALWAGLPVLTCAGEAFASRVAASVVHAAGLPELVTSSQADYEALAVELATVPKRLAEIKQRLIKNRLTTLLFDSRLFTSRLETAYSGIYDRYLADLPPADLHVVEPL
jgi:predicted O-linked N-acetylglucosamine transferase (SPINDLY family)